MRLIDWLMSLPYLPMSTEKPCSQPSRGEVKRWLKKRSVNINGEFDHDPNEEVDFEIFTLVFFPKGKRKTTYR